MLEALTNPRAFFQGLSQRKPNLTWPFLFSVLAVALTSVASILSTRLLPSLVPFPLPVQVLVALVSSLVIGTLVWGLGGAVVRLLAGADSRAWEVWGYSALPGMLMALVLLPLAALFPVTGNLPPVPQVTPGDPNAQATLQAWQQQFQAILSSSTYGRIQQVLSLLTTLWSVWVVYSGLRVFSPERSALTTAVVGAFSLGLLYFSLFR